MIVSCLAFHGFRFQRPAAYRRYVRQPLYDGAGVSRDYRTLQRSGRRR